MKRVGGLWAGLVSFENLHRAAMKARRGKRDRPSVARFLHDLERRLWELHDELEAGTYRPGEYRTFEIHEPKKRLISAAPFRDRVVHHALCNVIEPIFERGFIHDSYACRAGKGTHAAVDRAQSYARRFSYVLKADVRKFFPSIDHAILKRLIERKIKDQRVLELIDRLIDGSNEQERVVEWYPGDDLLTPLERRRGLPLGNQTSQMFANIYLNALDHEVRDVMGVPGYVRYCDDLLVFSSDKAELARIRERIDHKLEGLRLRLHPDKSVISPVICGIRFLGFRVFPTHRVLLKENVRRATRRFRRLEIAYAQGKISAVEVGKRIAGWIGHARNADTHTLRSCLFAGVRFARGAVE